MDNTGRIIPVRDALRIMVEQVALSVDVLSFVYWPEALFLLVEMSGLDLTGCSLRCRRRVARRLAMISD